MHAKRKRTTRSSGKTTPDLVSTTVAHSPPTPHCPYIQLQPADTVPQTPTRTTGNTTTIATASPGLDSHHLGTSPHELDLSPDTPSFPPATAVGWEDRAL